MDVLYNINFSLQGFKFWRRTSVSSFWLESCTYLANMTCKAEILVNADS